MLRYERKYLVPNEVMVQLRHRLMAFVQPDSYTLKNEQGLHQYTVRSIYFDSMDMECYNQKEKWHSAKKKIKNQGLQPIR